MIKNKTFLAIIPARAGSKRLKNKNLKILNKKPLISWTIEASLKSKYISETIVTTDSKEIQGVAKDFGAKVPFLRPSNLAQDESSSIDVVLHAADFCLKELNMVFDYIVLLQPTSPLRDYRDLDSAIELLFDKNADAVISVCKMEHNPSWANTLDESMSMKTFLKKEFINKRTQDLEEYYRLNGAIYICKTEKLLKNKKFFLDNNIFAYEMTQEHSVDIDTELDFLIAKTLMENNYE